MSDLQKFNRRVAGPDLRVISTMSVGYGAFIIHLRVHLNLTDFHSLEHIDLKLAARHNVKVGYTPDVLTDAGMIHDIFIRYLY